MFRQFTLRQSLAIITLVAVLAGVLRHLRLDSVQLYGFLLAPTLAWGLFRLLGIGLVPARWIARRLVAIFCGLIVLAVGVVGVAQHLALVLLLPLASVWIAQLVVISTMESTARRSEVEPSKRPGWFGDDILLGVAGAVLLVSAIVWLGAPSQKNGTGTAGNRYWYVESDLSRTEIQWENSYPVPIPWTWGPLAQSRLGDAVSETGFLGIVRYRIGRCEKLRFPNWLVVTLILSGPVATIIRHYRSHVTS